MNQISTETQVIDIESGNEKIALSGSQYSKGEMMTMGVITGVAATTIIETGKGVLTTLAKHPLVMFSLGIAAGFVTHKYRKEIISITNKTAEQSKNFVLRQKENIKDLIVESPGDVEDREVSE
ncbi:MAG: hypothetical protein WCL60_00650 [Methylococcales bacterium]